MATVSLETVKAYARIDGDEEDALLKSLTNAAEEYLTNAGIDPGLSAPALFQLAVCGIVLHWYEQRNIAAGAAPTDFPVGNRRTINQLIHTCQLNSL